MAKFLGDQTALHFATKPNDARELGLERAAEAFAAALALNGPFVRAVLALPDSAIATACFSRTWPNGHADQFAATVDSAAARKVGKLARDLAPAHGLKKKDAEALAARLAAARAVLGRGERLARRNRAAKAGAPLPAGTPSDRLAAYRTATVKRLAERTLKTAAHGHTTTVRFAGPREAPGFRVEEGSCFPYSGSYKTYSAKATAWVITVPRQWLSRVHKRGLAAVDGRLVLDATAAWTPQAERGTEVFQVVWAKPGRGFDVVVERAVIARDGDILRYGPDLRTAVATLNRALNAHR